MTDPRIGEILISEERLQARIDELAAEISADYAGEEVLVVGVLKGALLFIADLVRRLTIPCTMDFMAVSSYGASTRTRSKRCRRARSSRTARRTSWRRTIAPVVEDWIEKFERPKAKLKAVS